MSEEQPKPADEDGIDSSNMGSILVVAGAGLMLCVLSFAFFWPTVVIAVVGIVGYLLYLKFR